MQKTYVQSHSYQLLGSFVALGSPAIVATQKRFAACLQMVLELL